MPEMLQSVAEIAVCKQQRDSKLDVNIGHTVISCFLPLNVVIHKQLVLAMRGCI